MNVETFLLFKMAKMKGKKGLIQLKNSHELHMSELPRAEFQTPYNKTNCASFVDFFSSINR